MDRSTMKTFEELIEQYRPSIYNGTIPVSTISLNGESALLRVETASMASKVTVHEPFDEKVIIRKHIVESIEKSLRENSEVWDELSKY